jgi:hypothetical protein
MRVVSILLAFIIGQTFFSCSSEKGNTTESVLINMDSLINAQPISGVTINKTAMLKNETGTGTNEVSLSSEEELSAFVRIGVINLPVWRNSYKVTTGADPNSNLMLQRIYSVDSAAPVRELRITFIPENKQIIRLEARVNESGLFYSKQESLTMEFDPHGGRLEKYSVSGTRKIAWFESDQYSINASVRYSDKP